MSDRKLITLIIAGVFVCFCLSLVAVGGIGFSLYSNFSQARLPSATSVISAVVTPAPRATVAGGTAIAAATAAPAQNPFANATPTPLPSGIEPPASPSAIYGAVLPKEDLVDIAIRFRGVKSADTQVTCPTARKEWKVGDVREFKLSNQDTNTIFSVQAELRYKTSEVYAWVQTSPNRLSIDQKKLQAAMDEFSNKIIPTNRAYFGKERSPGVDCDAHLHVIHASGVGKSVGGYFSSVDSYPKAVRPDSNEGEAFIIHAERGYNGADPGSGSYMSTLSHELQHMISFNNNHTPQLWLEEGAAQLAERVNGYDEEAVSSAFRFAARPDTQLNTWSESSAGENSAHYGAAYLWWAYLYDRFGGVMTQKLIQSPERNIDSHMKLLADNGIVNTDTGKPYTFAELFSDYVVANYLGKQRVSGDTVNRFNYTGVSVPKMTLYARYNASNLPRNKRDSVSQFGTHYIEFSGSKPIEIEFSGSNRVALLPTKLDDGVFWWSQRGDESNPKLTREFDLTGAKGDIKMTYRAWYRIEKDYDYAYLSASTDGGATWKTLRTSTCTTDDPNKANLGCGYTGMPSSDESVWVSESADLSEFAGKKVQLRFELVTDAGVNREGLAIDNIEIPAIGFKDNANTANGWKAEGFVRTDDQLPQTWNVQAIVTKSDNSIEVRRMTLNGNVGTLPLELGQGVKSAVIAISPTTLVTTESAQYQLNVK